jgi:hypothetical protein
MERVGRREQTTLARLVERRSPLDKRRLPPLFFLQKQRAYLDLSVVVPLLCFRETVPLPSVGELSQTRMARRRTFALPHITSLATAHDPHDEISSHDEACHAAPSCVVAGGWVIDIFPG